MTIAMTIYIIWWRERELTGNYVCITCQRVPVTTWLTEAPAIILLFFFVPHFRWAKVQGGWKKKKNTYNSFHVETSMYSVHYYYYLHPIPHMVAATSLYMVISHRFVLFFASWKGFRFRSHNRFVSDISALGAIYYYFQLCRSRYR